MKGTWLITIILLCGSVSLCAQRTSELLNFGWKFNLSSDEAQLASDFDDSGWRTLDIPHDFEMELPFDMRASAAHGFKPDATGIYRKHFTANPDWKDKKVLLDFEGVMAWAEIYVNGKSVGTIDYGYLGAEFDISRLVRYDSDNVISVLAVAGKEGWTNGSRWYTGGGIFRDVHIYTKNPISFSRHGVYVKPTVDLAGNVANVVVKTDIDGMSRKRIDGVKVQARIIAPDGAQIGETSVDVPRYIKLPYTTVECPEVKINNIQLWDCDTPNLYIAELSLYKNDTLIDRTTEEFGLRTVEFTKEQGLLLNGKKVFLKGIANHHDLGVLGAAAYEDGIIRLFKTLKEFGFNHIRTSHNPYSPSFLKWADRMGILIVDELFDKWGRTNWMARLPFDQVWHKAIPEWIRRDRNHPSVIMWSLGNELQMGDSYYGFQTNDWGITTYRIMKTMLERYDDTRKVTVAMFPSRANAIRNEPEWQDNFNPPELSEVTDVASYNYQYPAYKGYLEHNPNLIIYQSEATTNDLLSPYYGMDREKMVGLAYWGAVEYWGESNGWPKKGWNYSYFNHNLLPYPQAWLIKSAFVDQPVIRIGVEEGKEEEMWNDNYVGTTFVTSHWNRKEGSYQKVFVYSNAEEVELLNNGKSLGIKRNNGSGKDSHRTVWSDVEYGKGGVLEAIGRTGGKETCRHKIETTGNAVALKLAQEEGDWNAGRMGLKYVRVWAIDKKGRTVPTSKADVSFEVTGNATVYAVDNDDHYSDAPIIYNPQKYETQLYRGTALIILRSTDVAGDVTIRAKSTSLKASPLLKLRTK